MSNNSFIDNTKIFKINIETIYLKDLKKKCILLKHTAEGVLFTKINKNDISKNDRNKKLLLELFTNFNNPMYEVLLEGLPTKVYLDCDFSNLDLPHFLEKEKIIMKLNNYLIKFLKSKNINTDNIIYSDASRKKSNNTYKISLHIVVNDVYIKNRKLLKELIKDFQSTLVDNKLYYDAIDTSVYNQPQLFKCVLSPSKEDNTLLKPFKLENNTIIYYDNDYIINNILEFLSGLYTFKNNFIDNTLNYQLNENIEKSINTKNINIEKSIIPENKKKWILNNNYIKNIYKLRSDYIINNKIDLIRINSANCKLCYRIHDSENAYCKITKNSIFFNCGRNPKGIAIGYWYPDYKKYNVNKTDNINNTTVLNNIIDELKEYITNLEDKYNKIKDEFNLLNNIHKKCTKNTINLNATTSTNNSINKSTNNIVTKKYTKDINSEMWQKYYNLGMYIEKGYTELYNNIRQSWRDGSVGRLNKRGLLIYKYINFLNENNRENILSLRKIFHLKNYEHNLLFS